MPQHLQYLSRSLAVVTVSLSLISYLPMPRGVSRVSALAKAATVSPALPAMQGEAAVQQLKQQGAFDSLSEAVTATRYKGRWEGQPISTAQRLAAYFTPSELHPAHLGSAYMFATWGEQQKLLPVTPISEFFGTSVAVSGDTAVIGAPLDDIDGNHAQGSAYVFERSGYTWYFRQKLIGSAGSSPEYFGTSVAISEDTIVVGAPGQEAAYVFVRSGLSWMQQQKLKASDGSGYDPEFGTSVAVSGGTVVVGTPGQEAAYVFVRRNGSWFQQDKLTASDGTSYYTFGFSVAISGDTAVIGAHSSKGANSSQGAAYVFVRGDSSWIQQKKLTASDGASYDFFGYSVGISSDTVVVGAFGSDIGSDASQGSAYIFVRGRGTWFQQKKLTAFDGGYDERFGTSVAIDGNTAVIGTPYDHIGDTSQGSAYVFVRSGTAWSQQLKLKTSGAAMDLFGWSVAIDGDTAVVGAPGYSVSYYSQGSAYVFKRID